MNENEHSDRNNEGTGAKNKFQNNQIPGFKLNWKTVGATKGAETGHVWKRKNQQNSYKRNFNILTIMNIVRESKVKGIDESGIWESLLKHRWDIENFEKHPSLFFLTVSP